MKFTLFISDLHLTPERPAINRLFSGFLEGTAVQADSLYVLGDLFEYWAGDDDLDDPFNREVCRALRKLSAGGTALYFMHGNRDFLMGDAFAQACGGKLIADPHLIKLYGTPTLLTHGDALCTLDSDYQAFRNKVRNPAWAQQFLAQPLAARKAAIIELRAQSEAKKGHKPAEIMDVTPAAVEEMLRQYHYPRLIHGHTHRAARHFHMVDGKSCERWVLNDWYQGGGYLRCDANGCEAVTL